MRVFVSYARQDRAVVDSLVADLERLGHQAWYDDDLSGGQAWWNEIVRQIQACDALVFVLSARSAQSEACKIEARYASDLARSIVPLRIDQGVSSRLLPTFLAERQLVNYANRDVDSTIALTRALSSVPSGAVLPDPLPDPPPVPFSYLTDLAARVASAEPITAEDQWAALMELRGRITDEYQRDDVVGLMRVLRRRSDLLAVVAQDIDQLLKLAHEPGAATGGPEPTTRGPETSALTPPALTPPARAPTGQSPPPSPPRGPTIPPAPARTRRRRSVLLVVTVIGVLIVGGAMALIALTGDDDAQVTTTTAGTSSTVVENIEIEGLIDACAAGDMTACDELFFVTEVGSDAELFGQTCGGRIFDSSGGDCAELFP